MSRRRRKKGGRYTPPGPPKCPCCDRAMVPAGELPDGWPPDWMDRGEVAETERLVLEEGWVLVERGEDEWSLIAPLEVDFG